MSSVLLLEVDFYLLFSYLGRNLFEDVRIPLDADQQITQTLWKWNPWEIQSCDFKHNSVIFGCNIVKICGTETAYVNYMQIGKI